MHFVRFFSSNFALMYLIFEWMCLCDNRHRQSLASLVSWLFSSATIMFDICGLGCNVLKTIGLTLATISFYMHFCNYVANFWQISDISNSGQLLLHQPWIMSLACCWTCWEFLVNNFGQESSSMAQRKRQYLLVGLCRILSCRLKTSGDAYVAHYSLTHAN